MKKSPSKLTDIGLFDCTTCKGNMCSGTAISKKDGLEKHLTVVYDNKSRFYQVDVCENANSSSLLDIDKSFNSEKDLTEFLDKSYYNFKCF